jgi:hypothetical protein
MLMLMELEVDDRLVPDVRGDLLGVRILGESLLSGLWRLFLGGVPGCGDRIGSCHVRSCPVYQHRNFGRTYKYFKSDNETRIVSTSSPPHNILINHLHLPS